MRVRLKRIYCVLIISLIKITSVSAHTISDTTKLIASLGKKMISENKSAEIIANVEYPENLQTHKDQSLEYVENFSNKKRNYLINLYEKGKAYFHLLQTIQQKSWSMHQAMN